MLGDFQYCSSASEDSVSEYDSDCSEKSDDNLDKLVAEKKMIEEKIQDYEKKLKHIKKTLRSLNDERNTLLSLRSKLISSTCLENENGANISENPKSRDEEGTTLSMNVETEEVNSCRQSKTTVPPLNLAVPEFANVNDVEEFDSDDDL